MFDGVLRSRRLQGLLAAGALLLWAAYSLHDYGSRGLYPTNDDQMDNLNQARIFLDHFIFYWRGPLYVAWLGLHLWLSGGNPETCFYLEKITSILILSGLGGWLGYRLRGWPAAMLTSAWILDCEPLLREKTNSHALAASLFTLALICAASPKGTRRIPFGLLALFLATQVRQELWIPFGVALMSVVAWKAWRGRALRIALPRDWILAIAIGALVWGVIAWRHGPRFPFRANCAFGQSFAVSYVERHGLYKQYPQGPWLAFHRVLREHMPALAPFSRMSPMTAMTTYRDELASHVLYNLRLAARAVPAMLLRVNHPILMLLFVLAYAASIRCNGDGWTRLEPERRRLILIWSASAALILPMLLLYRVTSRYLTPLIPAGILWAIWLLYTWRCRFKVRSMRQVEA